VYRSGEGVGPRAGSDSCVRGGEPYDTHDRWPYRREVAIGPHLAFWGIRGSIGETLVDLNILPVRLERDLMVDVAEHTTPPMVRLTQRVASAARHYRVEPNVLHTMSIQSHTIKHCRLWESSLGERKLQGRVCAERPEFFAFCIPGRVKAYR